MKIPFLDEVENRGIEKGRDEERNFIALNMLHDGLPFDQIQKFTMLSLDKIQELAYKLQKR